MKTRSIQYFINSKPFLMFITKGRIGEFHPGLESFLRSYDSLADAKKDFSDSEYLQAHVLNTQTLEAWGLTK